MKQLGFDEESIEEDPKGGKFREHTQYVIGGLMKRLLDQIPAKVPGTQYLSDDFEVQISNLYIILEKRVSLNNIYEVSLGVNMAKTQEEIIQITERIMSIILEYNDFCQEQREIARMPRHTPSSIMNHFQHKMKTKLEIFKSRLRSTSPPSRKVLRDRAEGHGNRNLF